MKVLLVEDDQNKRERLFAFIRDTQPAAKIETAHSYRSAMKCILSETWDLLFLDMTLPTYDISEKEDGFDTQHFAGANILSEMKRRNIHIHTIVVTQFETLGEEHSRLSLPELRKRWERDYPETYKGTIYYSPGETGWMDELATHLKSYDSNIDR